MRNYQRCVTTWMGRLLTGLMAACLISGTPASMAGETGGGMNEGSGADVETATMRIDFRGRPLKTVLDYVSRHTGGINVKAHDQDAEKLAELERMPVSVELSSVNWKVAVDYIAKKYGLVVSEAMIKDGLVLVEKPPRVTMSVTDAKIRDVIKLIAAQSGANIVLGPEVKGNVSFNISDVPWRDALDSVLKTQGFVKVEEPSGIIRITTPDKLKVMLQVKVFQLRYIQPQGATYLPEMPQSSPAYVRRASSSGGGDSEFSLLTVLENVKSAEGKISYERRTNQIIVKDTATCVQEMEQIINAIDSPPLQVLVSVRMLQVEAESNREFGVDWTRGLTASVSGAEFQTVFPYNVNSLDSFGDFGPFGAATKGAKGPVPLDEAWKQHYDFGSLDDPFDDSIDTTVDDYSSSYSLGKLSFAGLVATLQISKDNSNVRLVQAPQIVAMDNEEATIHVGRIVRYAEFYTETTDGGVISGYKSANPINAGVQLLVVPHVTGRDDNVMMTVVPKTEDFNGEFEVFGEGTENELRLPQTSTKVVVTRMMLKNMETGVIAGLLSDSVVHGVRKVPLLGDIPYLGYLFKR